MNCPICKHGNMAAGRTSLIMEKEGATLVIKQVPAEVCDNCGEAFVDEEVGRKVHKIAESELKKGIEIEVIHYAA